MQIDGGHVVCCGQWTGYKCHGRLAEDTRDLSAISSSSEESTERRNESSGHPNLGDLSPTRSVILESQQTHSGLCLNDKDTPYTKSLHLQLLLTAAYS